MSDVKLISSNRFLVISNKLITKIQNLIKGLSNNGNQAIIKELWINPIKKKTLINSLIALLEDLLELINKVFAHYNSNDIVDNPYFYIEYTKIENLFKKMINKYNIEEEIIPNSKEIIYEKDIKFIERLPISVASSTNLETLKLIITEIRKIEKSYAFQKQIFLEKKQLSQLLGAKIDQFRYKLTFF